MLDLGLALITLDRPSESLNRAMLASRTHSLALPNWSYLHDDCFALHKRLLSDSTANILRLLPFLLVQI